MQKLTFGLCMVFLFLGAACAQTSEIETLNLNFERAENGYPVKWDIFGNENYKIYQDSIHSMNGKFSTVIENTEDITDFKALGLTLPKNYEGKTIKLIGCIKAENVTEGYAGLWMRIDPSVAFDNMNDRGVTGTTDWQEYEVTLPLNPKKTEKIVIGGLLVGKGKMWLDNLRVTIDGKGLDDPSLKAYEKELLPAEKDKEFDDGSQIAFPVLKAETIDNLELLGKIWGFLKYHHPAVATGDYNWDYELFRMLPGYLATKNRKQRDKVLTTWIHKYGNVPACHGCKPTPNDAVLKPDLSWIEASNLSEALKASLNEIYSNRNQGDHYYIALKPNVENPDFTNENPYANMAYPDSGFRLLSLYRYWNMVAYFFPNRHLTDKGWDTVLKEYIPKFISAKDELEYELAAVELIGEVNDTHANLWGGRDKIDELRGNNYAAFRGDFVENKLVVTDYYNPELMAEKSPKIGDVITHINGREVASIVDSLQPYYPSSNKASMLRDVSIDLLRSPKSTMKLKYISENKAQQQEITLYEKERLKMYRWYKVDKAEKCFKMLEGNIGYVTLANINQEDIPEIKKAFIGAKGIIIDIRNYPTTFVPFALGSYFVSETTPFVKFTKANIGNPGEFRFTDNLEIPSGAETYNGKLMVLVNENSQSQAEYTTMAFSAAKNATVVGSTTAGADGNVSAIFLPGGLRTMISGIGVYYPDGTETQRIGIVPDVVVSPTIEGIKNGKDEVLEKAIELISQ